MLNLRLAAKRRSNLTVLCLGAHCDDIEIGCGGTLLRWLEDTPALEVRWAIFSADQDRAAETRASARRFLGREPDQCVTFCNFRDGFLPYQGSEVKQAFERLKLEFTPDVVFTHYRHDLHQDHRLVSELTWNTFRGPLILEYEIPKWDGDLGKPNAYLPLNERHLRAKIEILCDEYPTQRSHAWFEPESFRSLPRLRGMDIAASQRYAAAFYARKLALDINVSAI